MASIKVTFSKNDEWYTPVYAVKAILKYLDKDKIYWLPFDTEQSQFVKVLKAHGFTVEISHITTGKDFFNYEPDKWDVILSNPPYSMKNEVIRRAISFGKPFALLIGDLILNSGRTKRMLNEIDVQLLMFEERINYINPVNNSKKSSPFSSSYYCRDFLPQKLIIENLTKYGR